MTISESKNTLSFYCAEYDSVRKHVMFADAKKKDAAAQSARQKYWTLLYR